MNKEHEKLKAQKKLASLFFEMGMDEDIVATISGLSKEETKNIKKNKFINKEKDEKVTSN